MAEKTYLAVDLGASGGRVLAGFFDGQRLRVEELHRFENRAVEAAGSLYWDVLGLWSHVRDGLRLAGSRLKAVESVGVDTWGVDFALLARGDALLENPHSYRDPRTGGMMDQAIAGVGRKEIFAQTGLQFMPINTLYQFMSLRAQRSPLLDVAESLLLMPDLFHWLLTGAKGNEFTNATTTQFFNPTRRTWAADLFARLDLPARLLGEVLEPGTRLGPLRPQVAKDTGLAGVDVVLPGTHDTASAVLAVPAEATSGDAPDWCYISSGTWLLMGVELPQPVINDDCLALNFTNEGGVGQTVRLLKNITGLWLLQECRRVWRDSGSDQTWEEITRQAEESRPLAALVDPDHESFQSPGDMPAAIREFCRRTGQHVPDSVGEIVRSAIESVAMKSRYVLSGLEKLVGSRLETIHVVGGGTQNRALCQATADACGRPVVAGPVEATAIGNVLMQAIASGAIGSIGEAREIVRRSFPIARYGPRQASLWNEAYERFVGLLDDVGGP
ncbi:MAG TPA: rhamnulokinase family protein [Pirellulales bacterium]|nr:rhamnulokinase family protein [Pirellulales bacterium]